MSGATAVTEEIPVVEQEPNRRRGRWAVTWLAAALLVSGMYGAGEVWGQTGVNHALAILIVCLLIDRALNLDATEDARVDAELAQEKADTARDAVAVAREGAAEALAAAARVKRDLNALARIFYGEDDDVPAGRHGTRSTT